MEWKKERPTGSGWYWAYDIDQDQIEIANIFDRPLCDEEHYLGCEHSFDCKIGENVLWGDEVKFPDKPDKFDDV